MIELSGVSVKENDRQDSGIEIKVVGLLPDDKLYDEFSIDVNPE